MNEKIKMEQEKHSAFTTINGINEIMRIYEQLIMSLDEEGVNIAFQHNGTKFKDVFIYSKS